jgi:glutamate synthase (NADPH/NADH) large chain
MSGGVAYVWDTDGDFHNKLNPELVDLDPLDNEDINLLESMLNNHIRFTGSEVAQRFMDNFEQNLQSLVKVMPRDYKAVLQKRAAQQVQATETEAV